jgi:phosphoribosyl 1,2-cyclic phosphodiesterase
VRVHLCGVRGSTPAPGADFLRYGGHTSCLALAHDGEQTPRLVLDAGTGLRAVSPLLGGDAFAGTLLLTHLHWDHVQGLPFFAAGDDERARVRVHVPDQDDGRSAVEVLSRMMSPPHFPIGPEELRGDWSFESIEPGKSRHEGFEVLAREIPHKGGVTLGYRVSDSRSTLTYMPDHCPTELGGGPSGCGELHAAALELAEGADVLVHDAQLIGERELAEEGRFGHSAASYPVELGNRSGAKIVLLFHHRMDRTDTELDALAHSFAGIDSRRPPLVLVAAQGAALDL